MRKVTVWQRVEVDCFISPDTNEYGEEIYVIESAVPVKQELMDIKDIEFIAGLYESVDDKLADENGEESAHRRMAAIEDLARCSA